MDRRTALVSGTALVVAAVGLRLGFADGEAAVAKILHRRLDYLRLDPAGVARFAKDAFAHQLSGRKLRLVDAGWPLYERLSHAHPSGPNNNLERGEEHLVGEFLLSSDFFQNGADVTRVVRYLGYYDGPNDTRPCGNPFARTVLAADPSRDDG